MVEYVAKKFNRTPGKLRQNVVMTIAQHVEGDSTKLAKDMKKIIMALLYIL